MSSSDDEIPVSRQDDRPPSAAADRPPSSDTDLADVSLFDLDAEAGVILDDAMLGVDNAALDEVFGILQDDGQPGGSVDPKAAMHIPPHGDPAGNPRIGGASATGSMPSIPMAGTAENDTVELGDDTCLPPRRPVLRLTDLVAAVRATEPTAIVDLEAALRRRFTVDRSPEALRMAITCIFAGRFDAFTQLRERSVRMVMEGAGADAILGDAYAFMDTETGLLQDAGF